MVSPNERNQQPTPEFAPRSEEETLKNKAIVYRMIEILFNSEHFLHLRDSFQDFYPGTEFANPNDSKDDIVAIAAVYSKEARDRRYDDATDIPDRFDFPVYIFQLFNYDHPLQVTTPYGILPDRAIVSDNSKCFFQNVYFFNSDGQATKYEAVLNIHLSPDEEEDRGLIKLDIIPSNNKSRYVSLEEADYEKIEGVLSLIEFGKLNDKNIRYS